MNKKIISFVVSFSFFFQSLISPLSVIAKSPITNSVPYQYDQTGNLISDGQRNITYDASGMPSSITKGDTVVNFIYDGNGQRIAKIVKNSSGNPISATVYFGNIEKEIDYTQSPAKQTITKYYFAGSKRIALRKDNGDPIYIHPDHLSSSTLFTNKDGNKADSLITYYPYGTERKDWDLNSQLLITNYQLPTNHLYTDQIKDPETDLYYYNARYYNPQIGTFISADNAGNSLNKYAYASGNPLRFNDPTGHREEKDPLEPKEKLPKPPPIPLEDSYLNPSIQRFVRAYQDILGDYKLWSGVSMNEINSLVKLSNLMPQKIYYSSKFKEIESGDVLIGNQQISLSELTDLNKQEKIKQKLLNNFWKEYEKLSLEEKSKQDMFICADYASLFADIAYNILGIPSAPLIVDPFDKKEYPHAVVGVILNNQLYIIDPTSGSGLTPIVDAPKEYPKYNWSTLTHNRKKYSLVDPYWELRGGGMLDFSIFSANYISLN